MISRNRVGCRGPGRAPLQGTRRPRCPVLRPGAHGPDRRHLGWRQEAGGVGTRLGRAVSASARASASCSPEGREQVGRGALRASIRSPWGCRMERPGRHGRACLAFPRSAQAAAQDDQTRSQRRWPEWVRMLGPSRSAPAPAPSQWTEQPVVKPRSQLCRRLRVSGGGPRVASAQSLSECGRCRCCSRAGLGAWKVRGTESGQAWGQESWAEASSRPGAPSQAARRE